MVGDLQDLERRITACFPEDDLPPDIISDLSMVRCSVIPADLVEAWLVLVLKGFSSEEANELIASASRQIDEYLSMAFDAVNN